MAAIFHVDSQNNSEDVKFWNFDLVYFSDSEDENDAEEIHLGENTTAKRTRTLKKRVRQLCAFYKTF